MSSRSILQVFDQYQKARLAFVQSISELALRSQNCEILTKTGLLELLKPLLSDPCPQILQGAAVALGRLVHHEYEIAEQVIMKNFLPILLDGIYNGNKYQKTSVLFVLRTLCKHDTVCTNAVIVAGGLQAFIACLEDFEAAVKESAAWGIGYIARQSKELAQTCVDAGSVPLLMLCLQEPEVSLKQIATSAISDIAKHSEELAQNVSDTGVVPYLVKNMNNTDEKLKRQTLTALSSCAKHSTELSEVAVEAEIFPCTLILLGHPCPMIRLRAACLVRDVVKQSLELAQLVVSTGGVGALMELLYQHAGENNETSKIPCITALGYISANKTTVHATICRLNLEAEGHQVELVKTSTDFLGHSDQLAMSVVGCKAVVLLAEILLETEEDTLLSVTVWTLGQIGKHSPENSEAIASANVFPRLLSLYLRESTSEDLRHKCKNTLKLCLQKCLLLAALEPLLYDAPVNILKYILGQYSKVLPQDPQARRLFVTSGGLKKVQELESKPGTTLYEYITVINSCFPEEIVRFYSPGYPETLLEKVEQYSPQIMTVLRETDLQEDQVQTENMEDETTDEEDDNQIRDIPE